MNTSAFDSVQSNTASGSPPNYPAGWQPDEGTHQQPDDNSQQPAIGRRDFMRFSGAAIAGGLALRTGLLRYESKKKPPKLVGGSGPTSEVLPHPSPAELVGGPNWRASDLSGKTITLWGLEYAPHVGRYKLLANLFHEKTGCEVKIEPQANPQGAMLAAMASGKVPDVLCLMGRMSDSIVRHGGLVALDDLVYKPLGIDMTKWWTGDGIHAYYWDDFGQHFGVPTESNAHASTTVRTDLVNQHGAAAAALYPGSISESSWPNKGVWFDSNEELWELAKMLQVDAGGKVKTWGLNSQGWEECNLATFMAQQGVEMFDSQKRKWNFDTEAGVKAFETLVSTPYSMHIETVLGVGNLVNAFVAKETALARGNDSAAGLGIAAGVPAENVIQPSMVAGQRPIFRGEGGWGFELPSQSKNRDTAVEFLKFMTTYDAQYIWSQIYGGMDPACAAIAGSNIFQGGGATKLGLRRILIALESTRFYGHWDPNSITTIENMAANVRAGKYSAKEAAKVLQGQLTTETREYFAQFG